MKKTVIRSNDAPAAIGPYSQAIVAGTFLFVSGQLPINPQSGVFPGEDIVSQTRQALENIKAILAAAGGDLSQVVKTTVFMLDMSEFASMNEVYASYFVGETLPARAAVQVAALPKGARVEIEVIAAL